MDPPSVVAKKIKTKKVPIHGTLIQAVVKCPYCNELHVHGFTPNDTNHKMSECTLGSYFIVKPEEIKVKIPNGN